MKKFYVTLLLIPVFVAVLWIVGQPAEAAETAPSQSVQPAPERVELGKLAAEEKLFGENQLDSVRQASGCGSPTCIFPNCQPGPNCLDKCRRAYRTCLTYCDAITCKCLAEECLVAALGPI